MKKSYITPTLTVCRLTAESALVVGSPTETPVDWTEEDDQEWAE